MLSPSSSRKGLQKCKPHKAEQMGCFVVSFSWISESVKTLCSLINLYCAVSQLKKRGEITPIPASDSHLAACCSPLFSHHGKATKQMVSRAVLPQGGGMGGREEEEEEGHKHEHEAHHEAAEHWLPLQSAWLSSVIQVHDKRLKWAGEGFDTDVCLHRVILHHTLKTPQRDELHCHGNKLKK